ncbi:MAG: FtsQ-type POTRA domain-containing protein [Gammaproteobacteria bacterium]|nr:FtsQ-type POTRA domain-containing protein [Gammaproteobacteria bacterium]
MFSFRRQIPQAKKHTSGENASVSFAWKPGYNLILLAMIVVGAATYFNQRSTLLPIKTIELSGSFNYIEQKAIEAILRPYVGQGFFSLDIHAVYKLLSDQAWADAVSIRRVWPDQLEVNIIEKKPVARWSRSQLLSNKAVVYDADTTGFDSLPLVHAVNSEPAGMLRQFYALSGRFSALQETLVSLRQNSRGALDIALADGLVIKVGRSEVNRKIARLISIYKQQIMPRRLHIRQLDLRYSNGFAVTWKKEILKNRDEASIWSKTNV